MSDDIQKELEDALKADQENALDLVEAMDKVIEEPFDEEPTTDR